MPFLHRLLKRLHPQGIPWPGSVLYNALSRSSIFQRHYELVAQDIVSRCTPFKSLLDIGTGPAWLLIRIHELRPAMRLVGVDISAAMVAKAAANVKAAGCSDAVEVREASATRLPFEDNSFDAVVSTGSLHHWKDPAGGLSEVHRVLKPGGQALIYDLVKHTPRDVMDAAARDFGRFRITLLWLHSFEEPFYAPQDLQALAATTPFGGGETTFVGVLCCLAMKKAE